MDVLPSVLRKMPALLSNPSYFRGLLIRNTENCIRRMERRNFWQWLNWVFNRVDPSRIKEVGADRACAEWLLRCGASVKWKGTSGWQTDYNSLPVGNYDRYKIEEIDATDSSVMHVGFRHLEGVKHLRLIKLVRCSYLDDSALNYLPIVKDTLEEVHLVSCGNITDKGLMNLLELGNLKQLHLFDLQEVKDQETCVGLLRKGLPGCVVHFPPLFNKPA